jgi:hypothetical protein
MAAVVSTMMAAAVALAEAMEAVMTAAAPMMPTVMALVLPAEVYAATPAVAGPTVIAPRAMMTMAAVTPSVVPVAVATPANLRRRRLGRCCGFQRSKPCGRGADRSAHQACKTQNGSNGANSQPRHFSQASFSTK